MARPLRRGGGRRILDPCGLGPRQRVHRVDDGAENGRGQGTMTEAGGGGGRAEVEGRLVQRSLEDDAFRQRLLENPRAAVEHELGTRLPEGVQVRALEETAETIYLVLPSASSLGEEGDELSDRELEAVAGGWDAQTAGLTCTVQQTRCGVECA
jgi:hypothetical protein